LPDSLPRLAGPLAALFFYLALDLAFFADCPDWRQHYFGITSDPISFIWFLNWWPFAISHGINPFICKYVWYPQGFNMTWATAVPLLAIIGWPVTAFGGPVLTYNIFMLSAPAFGAWTAYLLCEDLTGDWLAALAGGFLFGFSAIEYWELQSELNFSIVCLVPLAVLFCVRRVRGSLSRRSFVLLLAALLLAQLGISTELLATLCVMGALVWAVFLAAAPVGDRAALVRLAIDIWIAAGVAIVPALPFLVYLVKWLPNVPPVINPPVFASAELTQFVLPMVPVPRAGALLAAIAQQFAGFSLDRGTYIGLPLCLILLLYFRRCLGAPYPRALLGATILTAVASLGPLLHWNGSIRHIILPWSLAAHLPLIRSVLPARLLTYVSLCTAVTAALWLARPGPPRFRAARFGLAGAACLTLIPARPVVLPPPWQIEPIFARQQNFFWSPMPSSPFFTPSHIDKVLGKMANVILLPVPKFGGTMAYQLQSGMQFTQSSGYVGFEPVQERRYKVLDSLDFGVLKPDFDKDFLAYCRSHQVGYILMGPGTPASLVAAIGALGWADHADSGILVVKTPYGSPASDDD